MNGIEKRVSKRIGEVVKARRLLWGYDENKLANMCRLQKSQIERIESGENYTVKTLINVMETLGLTFSSFSNINFYKDDTNK